MGVIANNPDPAGSLPYRFYHLMFCFDMFSGNRV